MPEPALKTFDAEAEQLYVRGMSAARGGQRTVAIRLLQEAVRLNPQHEQAWLWLSGVLDDPEDVIFCLRAVLGINPQNVRALRGLEKLTGTTYRPPAGAQSRSRGHTVSSDQPRYRPQNADLPWWMNIREVSRIWSRTTRLLWLIPLLLLITTVTVRTIIATRPLPHFETYRDMLQPTPAPATTAGVAAPQPERPVVAPTSSAVPGVNYVAIEHYWDQVQNVRGHLQQVTDGFRAVNHGSITSVERAAALEALTPEIEWAQLALEDIRPPSGAEVAHDLYISGLQHEREALKELLAYYSNGEIAAANRAGIRLQTARAQIADALTGWTRFARITSTSFAANIPRPIERGR